MVPYSSRKEWPSVTKVLYAISHAWPWSPLDDDSFSTTLDDLAICLFILFYVAGTRREEGYIILKEEEEEEKQVGAFLLLSHEEKSSQSVSLVVRHY